MGSERLRKEVAHTHTRDATPHPPPTPAPATTTEEGRGQLLTSQGIFRTFSPYDREPRRLLGDMLVLRGDRATGVTAPAGRSAAATTLSPPGLVLEPGDPAASAGAAPAVATVGGKGGALGPLSRATPRLPPGRAVAPDSAPAADSVAAGLGEAEEGLRGGGGGGDLGPGFRTLSDVFLLKYHFFPNNCNSNWSKIVGSQDSF